MRFLVLNLNHILRQPVKCDTLCNAAVQKTMENCCFVAGMHRITMGGWDFSQTLPVQPSPALYYTQPNCGIVSELHLSPPEVMLIREIRDLSASAHQQVHTSLPAQPWCLICSEPVDSVLSEKRCWAPTDPFNFLGFKHFCHQWEFQNSWQALKEETLNAIYCCTKIY